jgi:hypothetical protein
MSDPSAIPWAAIVSGVVGIAGTLLGGYFSNRAAESRRLAEQRNEDRTRFHKDRLQIYSQFISSAKMYGRALRKELFPSMFPSDAMRDRIPSRSEAFRDLSEARENVLLVASEPVIEATSAVLGAAATLSEADVAKFAELERELIKSLSNLRKAARVELHPAP